MCEQRSDILAQSIPFEELSPTAVLEPTNGFTHAALLHRVEKRVEELKNSVGQGKDHVRTKQWIAAGADVNKNNGHAMVLAASFANAGSVKALLNAGALASPPGLVASDTENTPIEHVAQKRQVDQLKCFGVIAKWLLDAGADPTRLCDQGLYNEYYQSQGIEPATGVNALTLAVAAANVTVVRVLLEWHTERQHAGKGGFDFDATCYADFNEEESEGPIVVAVFLPGYVVYPFRGIDDLHKVTILELAERAIPTWPENSEKQQNCREILQMLK